jgi:hypothetical protein
MYDTTERIYPGMLQEQIAQHLLDADERITANLPWEVVGGHSIGTLTRLYRGRDEKAERKRKATARGDSDIQKAVASILQSGKKGTSAATPGEASGEESDS